MPKGVFREVFRGGRGGGGSRSSWDLGNLPMPHGGVRPFLQKSTCLHKSTLESIWSRITPESGVNQILVLHRVDPHSDSKFETENL